MKSVLLLLLSLTFVVSACIDPQKEQALKERELKLFTKEQEFEAKQQEYEMLKKMRDSLMQQPDTTKIATLPEKILGRWNGKVICTESNCSEHVVGDLRNDTWEFSQDSVRIINNSGGERVYTSQINGSEIKLTSSNNVIKNNKIEIILQLPSEHPNRMKGLREITRDNCTAKFSVDLEKNKN